MLVFLHKVIVQWKEASETIIQSFPNSIGGMGNFANAGTILLDGGNLKRSDFDHFNIFQSF